MNFASEIEESVSFPEKFSSQGDTSHYAPVVSELADREMPEVLEFLSVRPEHTFGMCGLIHDNGLISPLNRGKFYCCRERDGALLGVALIGHQILFEVRSEAAIEAFAGAARLLPQAHLILGESESVSSFENLYLDKPSSVRKNDYHLMVLKGPAPLTAPLPGLRTAKLGDMELVMPLQARLDFEQSGIDPMREDPAGFQIRCARRMKQKRTWILAERDELVFKAEVIADTSDLVYLDGIWVAPKARSLGYGVACLAKLASRLLRRADALCLLVNLNNDAALNMYESAGFRALASYTGIFTLS
jgi:ribosomal protein S18 acetylase RimI-like enzyme